MGLWAQSITAGEKTINLGLCTLSEGLVEANGPGPAEKLLDHSSSFIANDYASAMACQLSSCRILVIVTLGNIDT